MERYLIQLALLDGDKHAFQIIQKDYLKWLSQQEIDTILFPNSVDRERLAADFYSWIRRDPSRFTAREF